MQYRVGVCSSCGAQFRIPATFEALKAKCKSCGGVVGVGPVIDAPAASQERGEAAAPPAAPGQSEPAPPAGAQAKPELVEIVPKKKERTGPSMKERLLAERRAARDHEGHAPRGESAATSSARTTAAPARREVPRAEPSAPARVRQASASSAGTRPPSREDRDEDARGPGTPPKPRRVGSARRPSEGADDAEPRRRTRGAGARAARGASSDDSARGRRGSRKPKKNPAPIVAGVALMLVAGFAIWKFVLSEGSGPSVEAADNDAAKPTPPAEEGSAAAQDAADDSPAEAAVEEVTAAEGAPAEEGQDGEPPAAAQVEPPKPNPDSVDLTEIADFDKLPETSDERWAELQELAATMIDPTAGAAGNRARLQLLEAGKEAYPAVLNVFKKIDVSTEIGYRNGDLCQKLLQDIARGRNFDWHYSTDVADQVFNKKAIRNWCHAWIRCVEDERYWLWFAKLESEKPGEPGEEGQDEESGEEGPSKRLKALEDLDD